MESAFMFFTLLSLCQAMLSPHYPAPSHPFFDEEHTEQPHHHPSSEADEGLHGGGVCHYMYKDQTYAVPRHELGYALLSKPTATGPLPGSVSAGDFGGDQSSVDQSSRGPRQGFNDQTLPFLQAQPFQPQQQQVQDIFSPVAPSPAAGNLGGAPLQPGVNAGGATPAPPLQAGDNNGGAAAAPLPAGGNGAGATGGPLQAGNNGNGTSTAAPGGNRRAQSPGASGNPDSDISKMFRLDNCRVEIYNN